MEYIVVQAGGKGTRLGHLTRNKPKALVPVENLPVLFHLFQMYPEKRFIVITDYHKDVLRKYLAAFAKVKYRIVEADGTGTCGGVGQAVELIPNDRPFMLVWSDLILADGFLLPTEYVKDETNGVGKKNLNDTGILDNYIGISKTFPCRWSYMEGKFVEERSAEHGVAGFFLFKDKSSLNNVPKDGELVRWIQQRGLQFKEWSLAGTREFGLLEEYEKLGQQKCRPFNRIEIIDGMFIKRPTDAQGEMLAKRECAWYEKAIQKRTGRIPRIYEKKPLKMEYIKGRNIYQYYLSYDEKKKILKKIIETLSGLHKAEQVPADSFSIMEAYYNKTMDRLAKVEDLIPFAREREIVVNGRRCRNVYYHKYELAKMIEKLSCDRFCFIHGDCTFSNLMLRENGEPVLIDPRGYFGYTEIYGDIRYDWAKLYYSIVGNYDRFNLKEFRLGITEKGVELDIVSNHWEDMEDDFFELTGADRDEIKLLHAVIWLSLTTYAWQDYDSVCGAFYNGLYYLEEVLS